LLQGFTGIGLQLDALANGLPPSLGAVKAQLLKLLEESDEYLTEARRSIWELRSPSLDESGDLSRAIAKASERALESTGIRLNFSVEGADRKSEPAVAENLLRICEEAVANAAKHAHPTEVEVSLAFNTKSVRLRIRDDGCGFDAKNLARSKDGHFGLLGIQERVESIGGGLSVHSQPGEGTEIAVTVLRGKKLLCYLGRPFESRAAASAAT